MYIQRERGGEQEEGREEPFHFPPKYSVLWNEMKQLTTVRRTAQDRKWIPQLIKSTGDNYIRQTVITPDWNLSRAQGPTQQLR